MKITRRGMVATALATKALAQNAPAGPPEELKAARDSLRRNSEAMAKTKLPMETEPAFQFKA